MSESKTTLAFNRLAGPGEKTAWHYRLSKWEAFDEIRIRIVPRYKTSGMSGNEWRHHVQIDFMFKGEVVEEAQFHDMQAAILGIGREFLEKTCPIPTRVIELEEKKCDQPSCQNEAVGRFIVKRITSEGGQWLDPSESEYHVRYRQFCRVHLRRGDCSREDSDGNYEPLDGVTPEQSTNTQESPSARVLVSIDSMDDLARAIGDIASEKD